MIKGKFCRLYFMALAFMLAVPCPVFATGEDTAQLTFRKTAISQKKTHPNAYRVRHGDMLSSIVRRIPGVTEKDIPRYYRLTRELNPEITDIDKIYEGQIIILPGRFPAKAGPPPVRLRTALIKSVKGDTLLRIVYREMASPPVPGTQSGPCRC